MSEHKTTQSNLTDKQKAEYRERREAGVRGQVGEAMIVPKMDMDISVPMGRRPGNCDMRRRQWMVARRQVRKGSTRGN